LRLRWRRRHRLLHLLHVRVRLSLRLLRRKRCLLLLHPPYLLLLLLQLQLELLLKLLLKLLLLELLLELLLLLQRQHAAPHRSRAWFRARLRLRNATGGVGATVRTVAHEAAREPRAVVRNGVLARGTVSRRGAVGHLAAQAARARARLLLLLLLRLHLRLHLRGGAHL